MLGVDVLYFLGELILFHLMSWGQGEWQALWRAVVAIRES